MPIARRAINTRLRVVDRRAFTDLFRCLLARYPSQQAAADALGIDRTRVNQLAKGRVGKWIGKELAEAIAGNIQADPNEKQRERETSRFTDSILTPAAQDAFIRSTTWTRHETKQFVMLSFAVPSAGPDVRKDPRCTPQLEAFRARQRGRGVGRLRIELAILRALDPITWWQVQSGGVEMSIDELHERGLLDAFLKASLRREELLLSRTADLIRRAQEVGHRTATNNMDADRVLPTAAHGSRTRAKRRGANAT